MYSRGTRAVLGFRVLPRSPQEAHSTADALRRTLSREVEHSADLQVCPCACVRALAAARSHTRYTRPFVCVVGCMSVREFACVSAAPARAVRRARRAAARSRRLRRREGAQARAAQRRALAAGQAAVRAPASADSRVLGGYSRGTHRVIAGYLRGTHSMPSSCAPAGVRPPTPGARMPLHPAHAPLGGCGADAQRAVSGRRRKDGSNADS